MKRFRTLPLMAALALIISTSDTATSAGLYSTPASATPATTLPPASPKRPGRGAVTTAVPVMVAPGMATTGVTGAGPGDATSGACEREIQAAAAKYGIPEGILYSVGLTETGRKGSLYPFAMNIEGKAFFPASRQEAMGKFVEAKQQGMKLIDIGCMQINHYFHGENFASPQEMFDPQRNVEYAAKFLRNLHDRHDTWTMAVARYHAGPNNDPAQKRYVCRVISNLVATGYGTWTPPASQFCRG